MNWKCTKCGKINNGEWCTACGAKKPPVNANISNGALRPVPNRTNVKQRAGAAKKKSSAPVVVLVVLAVLLVLGCAAFAANYFLNNYDESYSETEQEQTASAKQPDKKENVKTDKKSKSDGETQENDKTKEDNESVKQNENEPEKGETKQEMKVYSASEVIIYTNLKKQTAPAALNPGYLTYKDDNFNFKIDYPSEFKDNNISSASTRKLYSTKDGSAALRVCAAENEANITPKQLYDAFVLAYGGNVTYSPVNETWFAASLNDGENYHYAYYRTDNNKICGFEFHFSGSENLSVYSKYIDHIYASFK